MRQTRTSLRARGYDYAQPGTYFVTICVHHRRELLGFVSEGGVQLSAADGLVRNTWEELPNRFHDVTLDAFIVMPNHVHGLIMIGGVVHEARADEAGGASTAATPMGGPIDADSTSADASCRVQAGNSPTGLPPRDAAAVRAPPAPLPILGSVAGAFKSISAIECNRLLGLSGSPFWQRDFYDRIIRDEAELHRARAYIESNPASWAMDPERLP